MNSGPGHSSRTAEGAPAATLQRAALKWENICEPSGRKTAFVLNCAQRRFIAVRLRAA